MRIEPQEAFSTQEQDDYLCNYTDGSCFVAKNPEQCYHKIAKKFDSDLLLGEWIELEQNVWLDNEKTIQTQNPIPCAIIKRSTL